MSTYRVASGHNIALGSLTVLDPQPDPGPGIQVTRRSFAADGSVNDQGRYIEFTWSAYTNANDYIQLLGLFGLGQNTSSADVTIYVRDEIYDWIRLNGRAIRPIPGFTVKWGDVQSRPLDIVILVKDLATVTGSPDARTRSVEDDAGVSDSVTVSVV